MNIIEKKSNKNSEAGVSPVIGVMLMLVVTIIIAAVVSVFAGNMFENTETVPSAVIDVSAISNGGDNRDQFVILFDNVGGEALPAKDVRVYTYFSPADGSSMTRGSTLLSQYTTLDALSPGETVSTANNEGTATMLGWKKTDLPNDNSRNTYGIKRYASIQIELIHVPSQKSLYSGQVIIQ